MSRTWWPQRLRHSARPRPGRRRPRGLAFESLEGRAMLSVIIWENKGGPVDQGGSGSDSDHFEQYFGASAQAARNVVDAAIADWESVIVDFGDVLVFPGFVQPPTFKHLDAFQLDISAGDIGPDRGETDNPDHDLLGKPFKASIHLDDDAGQTNGPSQGNGWFFDPTPSDSVEFTSLLSRSTATGPVGGADFLRTVLHEMGHALGFSDNLAISNFLTSGGTDQVDNKSDLEIPKVNGFPTVTFTDAGGLHIYEGPPDPNFPGEASRPNDLMDSGRTVGAGERELISDLDAGILAAVYGYQIQLPDAVPQLSFVAQLNTITGTLTVTGDPETVFPSDQILIKRGPFATTSVNVVGSDILFPRDQIKRLIVKPEPSAAKAGTTLAGDDSVSFNLSLGDPFQPGVPLQIDEGPGTNQVGFFDPAPGTGGFTLGAGQLQNGIDVYKFSLANIDTFNVVTPDQDESVEVDAVPTGVPHAIVNVWGGNDDVDVEGLAAGQSLEIFAGAGDDSVDLGHNSGTLDHIAGALIVHGQLDEDFLTLYDEKSAKGHSYIFDSQVIHRDGLAIAYDGFEHVTLDAALGVNSVFVVGVPAGTKLVVNGGPKADHFLVGTLDPAQPGVVAAVEGAVTLDGHGGKNDLDIDDRRGKHASRITFTATTVGAGPSDNFFGTGGSLTYLNLGQLLLQAGSYGNTIDVLGTSPGTPPTIDAGQGNDTVRVGGAMTGPSGSPLIGVVDAVLSLLTLNGQDGTNTLTFNDSGDTTGDHVTLTASQVGADPSDTFFGPGGRVTDSAFHSLTLQGGSGGNTFSVRGTSTGTPSVTIHAGKGSDTIAVDSNGDLAAGGTVAGLQSSLTVTGDGGSDRLILEDSSDAKPSTVTITGNQVGANPGDAFFSPGGSLTYNGIAYLTLNAGEAKNQIYVRGTASGVTTTVNGGPGTNNVAVDSNGSAAGGNVKGVLGPLVVNGSAGNTSLTLEDGLDFLGAHVTVTKSQVGAASGDSFFGLGGRVTYSKLHTLSIFCGLGGDSINVQGTAAGTTTLINAGDGNDAISVDSNGSAAGGVVAGVVSSLKISGGPGTNSLSVEDGSDKIARKLTLTASQLGAAAGDNLFGPGGSLTFGGIAQLTFDGGSGGNTIGVKGQAAATAVTLNTGPGKDVITAYVTATSGYHKFLVNAGNPSGAPGDILKVIDLSGTCLLTNNPTGPGAGYVQCNYKGGMSSRIDYKGVEKVVT